MYWTSSGVLIIHRLRPKISSTNTNIIWDYIRERFIFVVLYEGREFTNVRSSLCLVIYFSRKIHSLGSTWRSRFRVPVQERRDG